MLVQRVNYIEMSFSWNILRLLCMYMILNTQCQFYAASPLYGSNVDVAPIESFPFIVSINHKTCKDPERPEKSHFCGGSLITVQHVLTAAHCLIGKTLEQVIIKIGSTNLRTKADVREVSCWYIYSQYYNMTCLEKKYDDIKDVIFDIAIIKLMIPLNSDFPLPTISYIPDEQLYNKSAVMAGWGRIEENKKPINMRIGKYFMLNSKKCSIYLLSKDSVLKEIWEKVFLCTDSLYANTGKGDSGSPLLYDGIDLDYPNNIVGVNKGSCPRGEEATCEFVNLHASVNAYRDFIESVTQS